MSEFQITIIYLVIMLLVFFGGIAYMFYDAVGRKCPLCNRRGYGYQGGEIESDMECLDCGWNNYDEI